jgi:signal transduction histidine kinase
MNIRTRLTLQFTLLVSGILLLTFITIYVFRASYVEEDFYGRLEKKALTTTELFVKVSEVDSALLKKIDRTNYDVFFNENLVIYDFQNREIYTSNDTTNYAITADLLNRIRLEKNVRFMDGSHKVIGILYNDFSNRKNQVVTIIGAEDRWGDESLQSLLNILCWLYLFVVVVVAAAGWYFAGQALSPILRIITQVKLLFPNKLDQSLTVENPNDEIGKLALTFNDLLGRLAEVFRLQNLFISNVSHELKNPLMRIWAQMDVAMLKERSGEEYRTLVMSVQEDIRELSQLAETLLELAKVNDEARRVIYGQVRIDEVLWDARTLLMSAEPTYLVTVDFSQDINNEEQLTVNGNPQLLKTAFVNLMENGCKFSDDAHVDVKVSFLPEAIHIDFQNTGDVIAPDEVKLIFQPFYRRDNTAKIKGYGVGLSLVERIIKLHGSTLSVHSNASAHTNIFTVVLPYRNGSASS